MERYLIKFTKLNGVKFISHLDTMRTLHRAFRRAGLPIAYSQGFNPHPSISVSAPLTLGISSLSEYADIYMDTYVDPVIIKERLNDNLPDGISLTGVIFIPDKMPTSMSAVNGASYSIKLKISDKEVNPEEIIKKILNTAEIKIMKRSKSGEKLTDVKNMIKGLETGEKNNNYAEFICKLDTGSKSSLSPEYASDIIKDFSEGSLYGYADICRLEIYAEKNGKWIDLHSYFTGK